MELYKNYKGFENRILSLYPNPQTIQVSKSPINKSILESLEHSRIVEVVSVLETICQGKLNTDFILSSLFSSISRKSLYYLYVEHDKIVAFCILGRENKKEFLNYIGVQQLKQYLLEQDFDLPNIISVIQQSDYVKKEKEENLLIKYPQP